MGVKKWLGLEQRNNPMEDPTKPIAAAINTVFGWLLGSNPTAAGELVNEFTALQHVTVYSCERRLSDAVGSLTLRTYERSAKGRSESLDDPTWKLLALKPNNEMSAKDLWTNVVGCLSPLREFICRDSALERSAAAAALPAACTEDRAYPPAG